MLAVKGTWRGVPLPVVLAQDAAASVAGAPLPLLNGAPLRLVVPSRRGLDWVK